MHAVFTLKTAYIKHKTCKIILTISNEKHYCGQIHKKKNLCHYDFFCIRKCDESAHCSATANPYMICDSIILFIP